MQTKKVLSLGAGKQSSALLLLSCLGILPKLHAAIFANTQFESKETYRHLWWLADQAQAAGIPLIIASAGNIKDDALRSMVRGSIEQGSRAASMPLYTKAPDADLDATEGRIRRQCTNEYKILVVERAIREFVLGLKKGEHVPKDVHVEQWIGISIDEKRRMRVSDKRWKTNHYPLIGWPNPTFDPPWTRTMCDKWFAEHYPNRPLPRSACIACPMHNNEEWRDMRDNRPDEWQEAVAFDAAIRHRDIMDNEMFVHRSCQPLARVDIDVPDTSQLSFTCLGMCGT